MRDKEQHWFKRYFSIIYWGYIIVAVAVVYFLPNWEALRYFIMGFLLMGLGALGLVWNKCYFVKTGSVDYDEDSMHGFAGVIANVFMAAIGMIFFFHSIGILILGKGI